MLSYCFIIYLQTARKLEAKERTRSAELIPLGVGRYTVHMVFCLIGKSLRVTWWTISPPIDVSLASLNNLL